MAITQSQEEFILSEIRSLSSGTIATLCREFAGIEKLRLQMTFVDAVQADFARLVDMWQR